MHDLHSLYGQFACSHFLISFLKACHDVSFLNSLRVIFQIFGPRNEIIPFQQKTPFTFGNSNYENCRKL